MNIDKIKAATLANLGSIIKDLQNIHLQGKLSFQFNMKDLKSMQKVDDFLDDIRTHINHKKSYYIYTISLKDATLIETIYERYKAAKETKKNNRAYARINNYKSLCLYVGSSNELFSRIKQHLGFGPEGTYAMQLRYWCNNLSTDIDLDIYVFDKNISREAFQTIEDGAWSVLKPMFGRQGKR